MVDDSGDDDFGVVDDDRDDDGSYNDGVDNDIIHYSV